MAPEGRGGTHNRNIVRTKTNMRKPSKLRKPNKLGKPNKFGKKKGSVMDILSVGICILALSIIMMAYLNIMQLVNTKEDISQLARQYILRMETIGYLTSSDRTSLIHDLTELGMETINLEGTTTTDVGYGNPVVIIIKGNIKMDSVTGSSLFQFIFSEQAFEIVEKRMSTAKN